ncbi:MAG: FtsQ-type POTRA domain-containing protein [Armatimonadota bacterium]|nr:FtsQ-type POTRA domain-containing protein [Armatimonadota bacterium]MDR7467380.1 FtsQ-type POTRA domain-containing protein [Armatimonadota bacterium]MDR7494150.1 FtsQ-type POTRA domain-containing protein [Armatimonadota bacterium]MDR7504407.1 FtsQ-type POTRA domain-containing protein [Armatimonadota bacterium]MDR7547546.1 FtsQ-type POTRA domain-containing protein [Armatimonadota bacterium]
MLRFGTVMAVALAAASLPSSSWFVIREVAVLGTTSIPAETVVAASGLRPGDRLLGSPPQRVARRVASLPAVEAAQVTLELGGRARIRVVERRPFAAVRLRGRYYVVDPSGVVIVGRTTPGRLPIVEAAGLHPAWVREGDRLPDPRLGPALAALSALPAKVITPGIVLHREHTGDLILVTADRITVRLGSLKGLRERAAGLAPLLDAVRARGLPVRSLDLRFAGNVVLGSAVEDGAGERR